MKKTLRFFMLALCLFIAFGSTQANSKNYLEQIKQSASTIGNRQWKFNEKASDKMMQKRALTATQIGPVNTYGMLKGPDGTDWTYTADFTQQGSFYESMTINFYNSKNELVGTITDALAVDSAGVIGVNYVDVNTTLTQKFFNTDTKYEVMIFIHAVTEDYSGFYVNNVYSLSENSTKVCSVDGTYHMSLNTSTNSYTENYSMIFQRNVTESDSTFLYYDIYSKAKYGTPGPTLKHTFKINYANIASSGNEPSPILLVQNGDQPNYTIAQYEKPYFILSDDINKEPEIEENNNLIINYYNENFELQHTTKIPVVLSLRYLYVFPSLGSLSTSNDVLVNYNGNGSPAYIITVDNYNTSSDSYITSFYLYDVEGKLLKTITEDVVGRIHMSNIPGQENQWLFMKEDGENGKFVFVDFPSCSTVAEFPVITKDEIVLSSNIDRFPHKDTYQYAVSLLQGETANDGTINHRVAWLTKDGTIDHFETISLGKDIVNAIIHIDNATLNPWLFNTDDTREYMALIYRAKANSSAKEEVLVICNTKGEKLLEYGPDASKGGNLSTIYLSNIETNPTLICSYTDGNKHTLNYTALPLNTVTLKGEGSIKNPYEIYNVGDFLQINKYPTAHFQLKNDIDFMSVPLSGFKNEFTGSLKGNNFTIENLILNGSGIFSAVKDSARISDIAIKNPILALNKFTTNAGILSNIIMGGYSDAEADATNNKLKAHIANIHVINPKIIADDNFIGIAGGIAGDVSLFTTIEKCGLYNAEITAINAAHIGGIAGQTATSTHVKACVFDGDIVGGENIGGIVSTSASDDNITNCHTIATLNGNKTIGGIVGISDRTTIKNCYAEGEISINEKATEARVGGIAGQINFIYGDTTNIILNNNIIDVTNITIPENIKEIFVHRVVGHSSCDNYEYNWDSISDYESDKATWPRIYYSADKCFRNSYVISQLNAFDANVALADSTTEGATLAREAVTSEWLTEHEFALGQTINAPWTFDINKNLYLWFESDGVITSTDNIEYNDNAIAFDGKTITTNGRIRLYNINGMLISEQENSMSTTNLNAGIYIVTVVNNTDFYSTKILVR